MTDRKKLIEVALPIEAINRASAKEKSIRRGHPASVHVWWARRPLATCRAVLFASLVDDPGERPEQFPTREEQDAERGRLFALLEELVAWENINNPDVLKRARHEISTSCEGALPSVLDPFCGAGSIPLEGQRLGLTALGRDLNPVAVLISKAVVEIPGRFAEAAPVNPDSRTTLATRSWAGTGGLAADVRHYATCLRDEAYAQLGALYPNVALPKALGGGFATAVAWIWARTVRCPNPACGIEAPLVRSWQVASKKGHETWVTVDVDRVSLTVSFDVARQKQFDSEGTVDRHGAICVACSGVIGLDHVRSEGRAGRLGARLMAVVADAGGRRVYLGPSAAQETAALSVGPPVGPETELPEKALSFRVQAYGMTRHRDLFSNRQLTSLGVLSDLIPVIRQRVLTDARASGVPEGEPFEGGGSGAVAYADAVAIYLGLALSKLTDYNSTLVTWSRSRDQARNTFGRQALPMTWDWAEINPFANGAGDLAVTIDGIASALRNVPARPPGHIDQADARALADESHSHLVSTDPPYYDNIGYADLSDYFYTWLRRSLTPVMPVLFSTLLSPKAHELVATPYRFAGGRAEAEAYFEDGLRDAFARMATAQDPRFPLTVYYAFKQAEEDDDDGRSSTGWETMLQALLDSGLGVVGTWPMRSERGVRLVASGTNALASSIVLVCRPRSVDATIATRKELAAALRKELPGAMQSLQQANIAPVDLAQSAIGPGMAVFSRYSRVIDAEGRDMTVRSVLGLINVVLDEIVAAEQGESDPDSRWCTAWFEEFGFNSGPFGTAETLSKAKNTSIAGLIDAGVVVSPSGKVQLVRPELLDPSWVPGSARRIMVWQVTHHLSRLLRSGGETAAATLLRQVGGVGDAARELAYRLFLICERKKWAKEASAYNSLVVAWPDLIRLAANDAAPIQQTMESW